MRLIKQDERLPEYMLEPPEETREPECECENCQAPIYSRGDDSVLISNKDYCTACYCKLRDNGEIGRCPCCEQIIDVNDFEDLE